MIKNYFKTAFRNLFKNKIFSAINIFGLAIGIAICLIIMLFVNNELGYDRYNKKADRMVRISFRGSAAGETFNEASIMPPVAQTMKTDFPEVQEATRIRDYGTPRLIYGDKSFKEDAFAFVDSNFFQVFTLPLIEGDAKTALLEPNTIVITKEAAHKYFGNEDPLGKHVQLTGAAINATITGVMKDVPENSQLQADMIVSMSSTKPIYGYATSDTEWTNHNYLTYILINSKKHNAILLVFVLTLFIAFLASARIILRYSTSCQNCLFFKIFFKMIYFNG